jgi:Gas vesicle synthesis protein GvpO
MATEKSAKKSTTKKSATKKSAAKKSTAKKSSGSRSSDSASSSGESRRGDAPRASAPKRPTGLRIASDAARQLLDLTGREAEGITGVERTDDGWKVQVEVVEVRRIPNTTDMLALYEIDTDDDGDVQGYRRLRRYVRGAAGES